MLFKCSTWNFFGINLKVNHTVKKENHIFKLVISDILLAISSSKIPRFSECTVLH